MKLIDARWSAFKFAVLVETVKFQYLIYQTLNMDKPDVQKLERRYQDLQHFELKNDGFRERL